MIRMIKISGSVILLSVILVFVVTGAVDAPLYAQNIPPDTPCLGCHVNGEGEVVLPSGEVLSVNVDLEVLVASVHNFHQDRAAETAVYCTDCHVPADYLYPHRPLPVSNLDAFGDMVSESCQRCHVGLNEHNPGHLIPQLYGLNQNLPTCVDCHGGHAVAPPEHLMADPIAFCQSCHFTFEDPRIDELHEQMMANLGPEQDCQTCHTDNLTTSVSAPGFATGDQCVICHSLLESEMILPSGDRISLHVTGEEVMASVHGERLALLPDHRPLLCVDCHDMGGYQIYPHDLEIPPDGRLYTLDRSGICAKCHSDIFTEQFDGVHMQAVAAGNLEAATCTDCHGAHDIQPPDEPRQKISQTCGECHSEINEVYLNSVHGAALIDGDPNVPTCTDCHGVHGIEEPHTALFRLRSPQVCAECHANEELMGHYGISTDVFDTYVADFHGTTVTIFEATAPDQVTNMAVCYDCHGVHNILPATDENSLVLKANLLETCQQCHPGATTNFPDAWLSHFRPSLQHNPIVYLVQLFYDILIPLVVGGFLVFVSTDVYRRVQTRRGPKEPHS
jgi:predicted CXXCH cytochrome family protein